MPVYDYDGTSSKENKFIYDYDGAKSYQIGSGYDYDGTSSKLMYTAEEVVNRSKSVKQEANPSYGAANDDYLVPSGFTTVTLSNFTPGKSYGWTVTEILVIRNWSTVATLRNIKREYTGIGWNDTDQSAPVNTYTSLVEGDIMRLRLSASYDSGVSGQDTSTASVTYTFT